MLLVTLFGSVQRYLRYRALLSGVETLDDRLLHDIGLNRGELSAASISGTGASNASLFCSTNCSAATEVISLTIEPMRNTVSGVIAGPSARRRRPSPRRLSATIS